MRYLVAETQKLLGMRAVQVALVLTALLPVLLTWLNGTTARRAGESGRTDLLFEFPVTNLGLDESMLGLIGIVVIATLSASSEFTRGPAALGRSRQVSTTLLAEPSRVGLWAAKSAVLLLVVTVASVVEIGAALAVARATAGQYSIPPTTQAIVAVGGYNLTVALLAHGLAALLRSAIVPIVVGVLNAGVVSFSLLLASVTPAVRFLPDMALVALTRTTPPIELSFALLSATAAAWVLAGWAALGGATALAAWGRDA